MLYILYNGVADVNVGDFVLQYMAPDYLQLSYEGIKSPVGHRDAVINGFVYVHQTLHQANSRVAKRGGRTMAITPRHYLDFIHHYVSSLSNKHTFF